MGFPALQVFPALLALAALQELQALSGIQEQEEFAARNDPNRPESEGAVRKTLETVRSGEILLDALDIVEEELAKKVIHAREVEEAKKEVEDVKEAKKKIARIVREIDKCISMLND